jgi:formate hydrogenlyase subunit 4
MDAWQTILWIAVAVIAAPLIGALLMGIDRKVTARMQGRIGPPVWQPFYDVIKLLRKKPIALNRFQIFYAWLHLSFMILVVVLLTLGQDILLILFVHAFAVIALVMGGMSVRSPYSRIGSHRKIMQMVAYEPILILMVVGMYLVGRHTHLASFMASDVIAGPQPLLLAMPLVFVALLFAVAIKLEKSPFDIASSHHAHQELVKGITVEYSGPYLAILEIAHFYEVAVLFAVIACFWATNLLIGLGLAAISLLLLIALDNVVARLKPLWMVKFMWTIPMVLALSNIIWLYY